MNIGVHCIPVMYPTRNPVRPYLLIAPSRRLTPSYLFSEIGEHLFEKAWQNPTCKYETALAILVTGVGITQSVWRRATGWTDRARLPAGQDFSFLHSVQTDSGAHPA
jgi:hypothetical protein